MLANLNSKALFLGPFALNDTHMGLLRVTQKTIISAGKPFIWGTMHHIHFLGSKTHQIISIHFDCGKGFHPPEKLPQVQSRLAQGIPPMVPPW